MASKEERTGIVVKHSLSDIFLIHPWFLKIVKIQNLDNRILFLSFPSVFHVHIQAHTGTYMGLHSTHTATKVMGLSLHLSPLKTIKN